MEEILNIKSLDTIVYLFKSLVLPNLNYGSIIWSPYTKDKYDDLNSVLKKFLRYTSYKIGNPMDYDNHDYNDISLKCKIYKAESIHKYNDTLFILNNIKGDISNPNFRENLMWTLCCLAKLYSNHLTNLNSLITAPINRVGIPPSRNCLVNQK